MSDQEYKRSERRTGAICIACLIMQFVPGVAVLAATFMCW